MVRFGKISAVVMILVMGVTGCGDAERDLADPERTESISGENKGDTDGIISDPEEMASSAGSGEAGKDESSEGIRPAGSDTTEGNLSENEGGNDRTRAEAAAETPGEDSCGKGAGDASGKTDEDSFGTRTEASTAKPPAGSSGKGSGDAAGKPGKDSSGTRAEATTTKPPAGSSGKGSGTAAGKPGEDSSGTRTEATTAKPPADSSGKGTEATAGKPSVDPSEAGTEATTAKPPTDSSEAGTETTTAKPPTDPSEAGTETTAAKPPGDSSGTGTEAAVAGPTESTSEAATQAPAECSHYWITDSHWVHHDAVYVTETFEDRPAWDEPVKVTRTLCGVCGRYYDDDNAYWAQDVCAGGYTHEKVIDHYIHHEATYATETCCVEDEWDELVIDGYHCQYCGEVREKE